ncbi:PHP domain-containing protein [Phytohalomonas tamaricis]|uniref:PHP domain-containing protein n=1 Tax=Phytohalomonas tamaricis TaxID=2081032 RepID=UPI000D0BE9F6|nr:PHP domain-containing protein [Phytohalomonas tamaricis]
MPSDSISFPYNLDTARGIDLHMHSSASDGMLSPTALVELCHQRGLTHIALTDHDTMSGVEEARQAAGRHGITLIDGCELSTRWEGVGIHVVALFPAGPGEHIAAGLELLKQARITRAEVIATRLERIGLDDALNCARAQAGSDRPLGRPDFARALVAAGLVKDLNSAFKKYLGAGKPGDVKTHWPALSDVVSWIVADGGVAVLAHPLRYKLTRRKLGALLDAFVAAGGEGAEMVSGYQNDDRTRDLASLLAKRGLYASLGSDFHFQGGPLAPGTFSPAGRTSLPPVWCHPCFASHAVAMAPP